VAVAQRAAAVVVVEPTPQFDEPPPDFELVEKETRNEIPLGVLPPPVNKVVVASRELRNHAPNVSTV